MNLLSYIYDIQLNMAYSKAEIFDQADVRLAQLAKALAHPARVAILKYLAIKDSCICNDIVEELPLSQSTVSQHLKALKEVGLIAGSIDGPRVCYCLDKDVCAQARQGMINLFKDIKCC